MDKISNQIEFDINNALMDYWLKHQHEPNYLLLSEYDQLLLVSVCGCRGNSDLSIDTYRGLTIVVSEIESGKPILGRKVIK